jgi:hypothetical protein
MMEDVFYVGFYAETDNNLENRNCCAAAVNLMNYVAGAVSRFRRVTIVSPSWTLTGDARYSSKLKPLSDGVYLQTCPTVGFKNVLSKALVYAFSQAWLFVYLLRHASRGSTVLVYHSPWLFLPVVLSKYLKRFRLVLQVCEIYQDATHWGLFMRTAEHRLIAAADRYLLSTEILNKKINPAKKPFCVCGGVYKAERPLAEPPNDGKTHLVYSGVIDKIKRGAFTAVQTAEFLDPHFHTHIIGFGRQEDVTALQDLIAEVNQKGGGQVTYEGSKFGDEFLSFLQGCHIGYSTQTPNHEFNTSSFPAKIFSYLTNRLRVVSISTDAIQASEASSVIHFYYEDNPREIANVVRSVDLADVSREVNVVRSLHDNFLRNMARLLEIEDLPKSA